MNSILDTLPPQAIQTLLAWCNDDSYIAVSKRAAKPISEDGLDLKISPATLCRLYTRHGISESQQARAEYTAALGQTNLIDAARAQLELRLLELATRPNPSLAELRLVFQITTRLAALQLSERRVIVAEKRETRAATPPPEAARPIILSPAQIKRRVRVLLGKEIPKELDEQIEREERQRQALEQGQT
jgi:hypothetical protein